jgi:endonuclease YncB( thermonuclease family)
MLEMVDQDPHKIMSMARILREIIQEMVRLPLPAKIGVGLIIPVIFVVVTQWERLTLQQRSVPTPPKVSIAPQQTEQRSNNFPPLPSADKTQTAVADAALAQRLARFVIVDPIVQGNGSITGGSQTLYLYGIKQFDSKKLCTRASGERWACGLYAYAGLRNAIAKKTIVCDPKTLLPNAVTATCRIGTTDIALALVRDGLLELDDTAGDADLANAQASARSAKLGIWDR